MTGFDRDMLSALQRLATSVADIATSLKEATRPNLDRGPLMLEDLLIINEALMLYQDAATIVGDRDRIAALRDMVRLMIAETQEARHGKG